MRSAPDKIEETAKERTFWQDVWRRYKKNRTAVLGLIFILLLVVIAFATIIIDAVTQNAVYEAVSYTHLDVYKRQQVQLNYPELPL